jgi:hypothetical protein
MFLFGVFLLKNTHHGKMYRHPSVARVVPVLTSRITWLTSAIGVEYRIVYTLTQRQLFFVVECDLAEIVGIRWRISH